MVAPTNVRSGAVTALFLAAQAARGTAATVFSSAQRLWTTRVPKLLDSRKHREAYMGVGVGPSAEGSWDEPELLRGTIEFWATPTTLATALGNVIGAVDPVSIMTQLGDDDYVTLAWVEQVDGALGKVVRLRDAWLYDVEVVVEADGKVKIVAQYAATAALVQDYSAGGLSFPASPMLPTDLSAYPGLVAELRRDPAGANQSLRFARVSARYACDVLHEYTQTAGGFDVAKGGPLHASLTWRGDYSDESWVALVNALADTRQTYRVVLYTNNASGGQVQLDFSNFAWEFLEGPGHAGSRYAPQIAHGEALIDVGGTFIAVTIA